MPKQQNMRDLIASKVAEMQASQAEQGETPDPALQDPVYLGGNMEENQKAFEEAEAEDELARDSLSSKSEREQSDRIKELEAQIEKMNRRWKFGDYSDLPVNFPFEITIQPVATAGGNLAAEPVLNGHKYIIPRGVPTNVPKALLENLDSSKYKSWEQILDPRTSAGVGGESARGVHWVEVEYHRYPYSARPLYHLADDLTRWPGIFEDVPSNHLGKWKDVTDEAIEAQAKREAQEARHSR